LYGEEDSEAALSKEPDTSLKTPQEVDPSLEKTPSTPTVDTKLQEFVKSKPDVLPNSLPAKPPSPGVNGASYSAQIARQFSAYQQTPNQEHDSRPEVQALPDSRSLPASSAVVLTPDDSVPLDKATDRPILRPSDMKDEG
jgi:hypothetical protein